MASDTSIPSTRREMPCRLPSHPPWMRMERITPSSTSSVIRREPDAPGLIINDHNGLSFLLLGPS